MDIGLLNQHYHQWITKNSETKTNHPESIKNLWVMINKKLNEGMDPEKYWIVQTHALNLTHEIMKFILGSEYNPSDQNDNINKLIALGYDIQVLERLDFLRVANFTSSSFERLAFSLKSIGNLFYKLRIIEKEDILLNPDKLRAEDGEVIEEKCIITKFIGASEVGRVLEATYLGMDKKVAVKEVSKNSYSVFDHENEKRILMALEHPAIPKIYDILRDNQTHYIVMDFIEGTTLTAYIEEHGKLELPLVIKLAKELIEMINYLNTNKYGRINSDLNPDIIMIDGHQHLHLIDFGVNYNKKPKHDKISMFTGGANYLSPELIEGKGADLQSDIFSLGGVIYYMAEGRKPIPGNRQSFRNITDYNLIGIIEKAMAKNLKMRYLNTSQFLHDIELLEALLEKSDINENEQKDSLEALSFSDFSSPIATMSMSENKCKQEKSKKLDDKSNNPALNFGVQLFIGILFISGIIFFMYLINNRF